jgi:hypothetical protein
LTQKFLQHKVNRIIPNFLVMEEGTPKPKSKEEKKKKTLAKRIKKVF